MATITGTDSNDIVRGTSGDDTLYGLAGNDSLTGSGGADALYGGAGNDTLSIDAADTVIDGGDGIDTVVVQGAAGVTLDLGASSVERATGGVGADTLNAATAQMAVTVYGGAGDDTITGSAFNDNLRGDAGDDTISGGAGNDVIQGGVGADRLYGGDGDDTLYIDAADILIDGGTGTDTIRLSETFDLTLDLAASGIERVYSGAGADLLDASAVTGTVLLYGGTGADTLLGGSGNDDLRGDDGDDTIQGGAGNDVIFGGAGGDRLFGGTGNDTLYIDAFDTTVDGGEGSDSVYVQGAAGVSLDLAASAIERAFGGAGADQFDGVASSARVVAYGGVGDDTIYGSGFNDDLRGDDGDDVIDGGAGNDVIYGGIGADRLSGGAGDDTLYIDAADTLVDGGAGTDSVYIQDTAGVTLDLGANAVERVFGGAGGDVLDGGASASAVLIYGGAGTDAITGSALNDDLRGDAGDDVIDGGAGNDVIYGGSGADQLHGGAGDDRIYSDAADTLIDGGAGIDTLTIQDTAGVIFNLGAASIERVVGGTGADTLTGSSSAVGVTIYGGAGNDAVTGSGFNDDLRGDAGDDTIQGGAGNDVVYGGAGADVLYGEGGNDTFYIDGTDTVSGGDGTDSVYIQDAAGVTLDLGAAAVERAFGGTGNDTLTGASSGVGVTIYGGTGNDTVTGSAFNDDLRGDAGDDVLEGGAGRDVLYGGAGIDTARYDHSSSAVTVSLLTGKGTGGHAEGDTFNGVENIIGSAFADRLEGDANANRLTGGGGADTLLGGAGGDVLEVADTGFARIDGGAGDDTLRFGGQTLTLAEKAVTNLEHIDLTASAGQVLLLDYNSVRMATDGRQTLRVSGGVDGTVVLRESDWMPNGTETVNGQEYDVYSYGGATVAIQGAVRQGADKVIVGTQPSSDGLQVNQGDGDVLIFTSGADLTLQLGSGLSSVQARLERSGNDLVVRWDGSQDSVTVVEHFAADGGAGNGSVAHIRFNDSGSLWDIGAGQLVLGSAGDDILAIDQYQAVSRTFQSGGGQDEVVLSSGIPSSRIQLMRQGNDLNIMLDNAIKLATVINHFDVAGSGSENGGVQRLRFFDSGEVWELSGDDTDLDPPGGDPQTGDGTITGTALPDYLEGDDGANHLIGGGGADTLVGKGGDDLLEVSDAHFGRVDGGDGYDTLRFGGQSLRMFGWQVSSVEHIQLTAGAGQLLLLNQYMGPTSYDGRPTLRVSGGSDSTVLMEGSGWMPTGTETIDGQEYRIYNSNGAIIAVQAPIRQSADRVIVGSQSGETFWMNQGDGNVMMFANGSDDTLMLSSNFVSARTRLERSGNDLIVRCDGTEDSVTVVNHFALGGGEGDGNLDRIRFYYDGGTWDTRAGHLLLGTAGDDTLALDATQAGIRTIVSGGGQDELVIDGVSSDRVQIMRLGDHLHISIDETTELAMIMNHYGAAGPGSGTGAVQRLRFTEGGDVWDLVGENPPPSGPTSDTLFGTPGDDTFEFGRGAGADTIVSFDFTGSEDKVAFGFSIRSDQLWFEREVADLRVSVIGGSDSLTIQNWYAGSTFQIESFTTYDGTTLHAAQVEQLRSAMAAFTAPAAGQYELSEQQHATLDSVIAASWQ